DVLAEVMLEPHGADVDLGAEEVAVGETVEILSFHRGGRGEQPRQPVVRRVEFLQMEIVDEQTRVRAQTEGERRSDPDAAVLAGISVGYSVEVAHQVEPEGRTVEAFDRLIDIGGEAIGAVGAE